MEKLNKALFYYFILQTDNKLDIISKTNKTYFNSIKISYYGIIKETIIDKEQFMIELQNIINLNLINKFESKIIFELNHNISEKIKNKYLNKKLEFELEKDELNILIKKVLFENKMVL
ncbi:hypothetical protein [Flavobacterium psychrophilum]|uniref:hypothetical protein n=1 Tax=Flavobacterium psychrophilum TaxID=96345 RepID=UPI0011D0BF6E|nr:hypothetical protein [Flavobacterium psychrophilum]